MSLFQIYLDGVYNLIFNLQNDFNLSIALNKNYQLRQSMSLLLFDFFSGDFSNSIVQLSLKEKLKN